MKNIEIINKYILSYEQECNNLVKLFVTLYDLTDEWDWAGGEVGDFVFIGDMTFDIYDIKTYLTINPSIEEMHEAYEIKLEGKTSANLRNWLKYPSMRDSWKK